MSKPALVSPTCAEIDLDAIRTNYRTVKEFVAPAKVMAVVKANAYGHGLRGIARVLAGTGVDYFGVSQVSEGMAIRETGVSAPILVLGPLLPEEIAPALSSRLDISVVSANNARAVNDSARKHGEVARIHFKIDTGMGRVGFWWADAVGEIEKIASLTHLDVAGIFTHFAVAVNTRFARQQLDRFFEVLFQLERKGIQIPLKHAANSGAILNLPEAHLDMVRSGIMVFGCLPSPKPFRNLTLRPAMTLRSKVKQVKEVEDGTGISYGLTYTSYGISGIASIPVGYGDGYKRGFSGKASVLINGKRYPVAGRVCMDWIMTDLGPLHDVREGDEVILFGRKEGHSIALWELAEIAETIPYEILCGISERVPRIYLDTSAIAGGEHGKGMEKRYGDKNKY